MQWGGGDHLSPRSHSWLPTRPAAPLQNVAAANDSGNTALHWACLMGQEQVTRLLMEAGANPSALNKWVAMQRGRDGACACSAQPHGAHESACAARLPALQRLAVNADVLRRGCGVRLALIVSGQGSLCPWRPPCPHAAGWSRPQWTRR